MTGESNALGRFEGKLHLFPVRVYFEDTDLSSLVYHANYLRFMERARSDLLRGLGIDQRAVFDGGDGAYAVADLSIRFAHPARLGDDLIVESRALAVGAATATIGQRVLRDGELLTEATVIAAFLTMDGRPKRQPQPWRDAFTALIEDPQ